MGLNTSKKKQHIQIGFMGQKQAVDLKPARFSPSLDKLSTTIYTSCCVLGRKKGRNPFCLHMYIYA